MRDEIYSMEITRELAQEFNELIGDDNPIHKERDIVPGMLVYEIGAHFFDSDVHGVEFKKLLKYDHDIQVAHIQIARDEDGVKIYNNDKVAVDITGNSNCVNRPNNLNEYESLGNENLSVSDMFKNFFGKTYNENDKRAALASSVVGALSKDFYSKEENKSNIILKGFSFKFLGDVPEEFEIYKHEDIDGRRGTISVDVLKGDEKIAIGCIYVAKL